MKKKSIQKLMKENRQDKKIFLDQFYTKKEIAQKTVLLTDQKFSLDSFDFIVEPSAGCGSFLDLLPTDKTIGIDLEPADPLDTRIFKHDYLKIDTEKALTGEKILVIGNPPFGNLSSLAVDFFNKSAEYATVIAFIVPRTFRKPELVKRLNKNFHLVEEEILPEESYFLRDGTSYKGVPTVFQIWEKRKEKRIQSILSETTPVDWKWVKTPTEATHAIRRVGGLAGKILDIKPDISRPPNYFINSKNPDIKEKFKEVYDEYWKDEKKGLNPKWDTAGIPSLSQKEICHYYNKFFKQKEVNNEN